MKAIVLLSGGLDSTLAARIMQDFSLELIALNTASPFCLCNHTSSSGCFHGTAQIAKELGIRLVVVDVSGELIELVKKPKHGYGSNMNPCIDCRILLFRKARELMEREGASFIITGEVAGQRPMSQKSRTMELIDNEAGLTGFVVRPLSARILEPSVPEQKGWIDREKLFAISGRGRRDQMLMAKKFGINDYPCPSGGCLLTDPGFAKRVKDLMRYGDLCLSEVRLLKVGRHFRLSAGCKLVVGRNQQENESLEGLAGERDYIFRPPDEVAGPVALGRGTFDDGLIQRACSIVCRYCDLPGAPSGVVLCKRPGAAGGQSLTVFPMPEEGLAQLRI